MTDYIHLTVPEKLGEKIREHDGRNDAERIYNWAGSEYKEDIQKKLEENLKTYIDSQIDRLTINQRTGEIELR